jgi:hypothetical protein
MEFEFLDELDVRDRVWIPLSMVSADPLIKTVEKPTTSVDASQR